MSIKKIWYRKRPMRCGLCRHRAGVIHQHSGHAVSCPGCGIHTQDHDNRRQAVADWNNRA